MSYVVTFPALRIERRFADAILAGRKMWELRKRPLDIGRSYLLCVEEDCDRVVGAVEFGDAVGAFRGLLLRRLRAGDFRPWSKFMGLPRGWLEGYAKDYEPVWAHLVLNVARFGLPAGGRYRNRALRFETVNLNVAEEIHDAVERLSRENMVNRYDMWVRRMAEKGGAE